MYGIKNSKNEWFTGLHYPYNKDQDKSRTEVKRLFPTNETLIDEQFTSTAGWVPSSSTVLSISSGVMVFTGTGGAKVGAARKVVPVTYGQEYTIKGRIRSVDNNTTWIRIYYEDGTQTIFSQLSPTLNEWYEFEVQRTFTSGDEFAIEWNHSGFPSTAVMEIDYLTVTYVQDNGFVKDEDYDDDGYYTIPTEVKYKHYVERVSRNEWTQNARNKSGFKEIEISRDYSIKVNDRFKTMDQEDDATPFKVDNIDVKRLSYKSKATLLLPGLYKEYNNTKIVALR